MKSMPTADAVALLDSAINATERQDTTCAPSDFSTEDDSVLLTLRERKFEIQGYSAEVDGKSIIHEFILKVRDSGALLSAEVVAVRGRCRGYTFGQITQ